MSNGHLRRKDPEWPPDRVLNAMKKELSYLEIAKIDLMAMLTVVVVCSGWLPRGN